MLSDRVEIARASQLNQENPLPIRLDGAELVLIRAGDQYSLFQGHCPHQGASLAQGTLEKDGLTCASHHWCFDPTTGKKTNNPNVALQKFQLDIEGDRVFASRSEIRTWLENRRAAGKGPAPKRFVKDIPGPKGLPLIGNMHQLKRSKIPDQMLAWANEFGNIYKFRMLQLEFIVVSDADMAQEILKQRPEKFRRLHTIEPTFAGLGVAGLFSHEGETWKRQRTLTMPAFNSGHLRQFFPTLKTVTERLRRRWDGPARNEKEILVQKDLMRFTVDITTSLAFGHDMNTLETEGDVVQDHLEQIFPALGRRFKSPIPYWKYITLPADRRTNHAIKELEKELAKLIQATREKLKTNPELKQKPSNFLEGLLASGESEANPLSDKEIMGNVLTILVAGEDTTANALAWMLDWLVKVPEVQKKIQQEVDDVLGADPVPQHYDDLEKFPYLEAVVNETMRLTPVAPYLMLEANYDTELDGLQLKKGTIVGPMFWKISLQEENFSSPQEFLPERWLPERPAHIKNHNPKAFMPFGSGARFCPGRHLAMLEIKHAMAMICHNFDLLPSPTGKKSEGTFTFVHYPENLWIQLKRRPLHGTP